MIAFIEITGKLSLTNQSAIFKKYNLTLCPNAIIYKDIKEDAKIQKLIEEIVKIY